MGIIDDMSDALSRGTGAAERAARTARLKSQLNDVNKRRQGYAAQLGAVLYEKNKAIGVSEPGCEELYAGIAQCDAERDSLIASLEAIKNEADREAADRSGYQCSVCGSRVAEGDLFCSGCGASAEKARGWISSGATAAHGQLPVSGAACQTCGAALGKDFAFCIECGTPVQSNDASVRARLHAETLSGAAENDLDGEEAAADIAPDANPQAVQETQNIQEGMAVSEPESAAGIEAANAAEEVVEIADPGRAGDVQGAVEACAVLDPEGDDEAFCAPEADANSDEAKAPAIEQEVPVNTQMLRRYCMNCGSPIAEGHRFCMECGTPIASEEQEA